MLIVEDDPAFIYLIYRYCIRAGLSLVSTSRGEEALDLARKERPALILLDIRLPGMDGWEVLRELKTDPTTTDIPVVLCSALSEEERAIEEGADGYLRKPVQYRDIVAVLEKAGVER
jgi:CheY-like chemotaxis protein